MLARQVLRRCRCLSRTILSSRSTQHDASQTAGDRTDDGISLQFTPHGAKKPRVEPFMKVMVSGIIDYERLEFPEALSVDRYRDFFFWISRVADFVQRNENRLPRTELISELSKLGVFRGSIGLHYGGLDFSDTELCKLIDTLSYIPWLGALLAKTNVPVAKILQAHASDKIKETYLGKIATGELQPTLCYLESANKWNLEDVEATCMLSDTGDHWLINGKKLYVANAENSDLFLVFARCTDGDAMNPRYLDSKSLAMFLVEKDPNSMIIEPATNVVGLKGLNYATVTFKDTRVSKDNMIGNEQKGMAVFIDLLAPQNQYTGPQCVGMFKRCLNNLINFTLSRKYLEKNLHESQMVKVAVAELAYELFVMESLVYMTSGIEDMYEDQDVEVERCIMNYYCASHCMDSILKCLKIVGPESVYGEDTTMGYLNDALPSITFDINEETTKNLLSLMAVQFYTKDHKDIKVNKLSAFEEPGKIWERFFGYAPPNMYKTGQLHPSMRPGVLLLSKAAHKLNGAMNLVTYRYGRKVAKEQVECGKLGDMMAHCYALAATMSRASRSYCIGLRNAHHDVSMALMLSLRASNAIDRLHEDITNGAHVSGVTYFEKIANELYDKKGYYVADALQRNW